MSIKAVVKFNRLRASARASVLRLAYRVGSFIKVRRLYDTPHLHEDHSARVAKPLTGTTTSLDNDTVLTDKPRYDSAQGSEAKFFSLTAPHEDQARVGDEHSLEDEKPLTSGSAAREQSIYSLVNAQSSMVGGGEQLQRVVDYNRLYVDALVFQNDFFFGLDRRADASVSVFALVTANLKKPITDVLILGESLNPWMLQKALGDHCTSCDAFGGQSVALDFDTQSTNKVIVERAYSKEKYFALLDRNFTGAEVVSDIAVFTFTRAVPFQFIKSSDALRFIAKKLFRFSSFIEDSSHRSILKSLADTQKVNDSVDIFYYSNRFFFGVLNTNDEPALALYRTLNDQPAATVDTDTFEFAKRSVDAFLLSDSSVVEALRPTFDLLGSTESLYRSVGRALSPDAVAALSNVGITFSRSSADSATSQDALVRGVTARLADQATPTDNGQMLVQNYVDDHYFADDYVGTRQTF